MEKKKERKRKEEEIDIKEEDEEKDEGKEGRKFQEKVDSFFTLTHLFSFNFLLGQEQLLRKKKEGIISNPQSARSLFSFSFSLVPSERGIEKRGQNIYRD